MNFTYTIDKDFNKIFVVIENSGMIFNMLLSYEVSFDYRSKSNKINLIGAKNVSLEWDKNWTIDGIIEEDSCIVGYLRYNYNKNRIEFGSTSGSSLYIEKTEDNMQKIDALIDGIIADINN